MNVCCISQKKLFGVQQTYGFYEIENNCIMAFYYKQNEKVELFYNLSDLKIVNKNDAKYLLIDSQKRIEIEVNKEQNLEVSEESDKYFDFQPSGYKEYEAEAKRNTKPGGSFTPDGVLRCFNE